MPQHASFHKGFFSRIHAVLVHSITHIGFNAIHLALDAAYRFRDLPFHREARRAVGFSEREIALLGLQRNRQST